MSTSYVNGLPKSKKITAPYLNRGTGKADPEDLKTHVTETSHIFVNFESSPGGGVTSLNSPLVPEKYTLTASEMKFVGEKIVLNGTPIKVHATIDLTTMTGMGRVEVLDE
jgi:hypothetical protein